MANEDDDIFEMLLTELKRILREISRALIEVDGLNEAFKGGAGFKELLGIRVEVVNGENPKVVITRFNPKASPPVKREDVMAETVRLRGRRIKCVLKPKALISESNREVFIAVELPDIKSEKNVEVRPVGRSIEILAVKNDGGAYFDIFEIPSDADINAMAWEFKEGRLEIRIPKIHGYSHW